jgi:hypothetical protein
MICQCFLLHCEPYPQVSYKVLMPYSFQGILTLQAYIYYERYEDDPMHLKILVSFALTIDLTRNDLCSVSRLL